MNAYERNSAIKELQVNDKNKHKTERIQVKVFYLSGP